MLKYCMNYSKLANHIEDCLFKKEVGSNDKWPIVCDLHESFAGDLFDEGHNCLGCNFAHYTWGLLRTTQAWATYLESCKDAPPIQLEDFYPTSVLFHWLNTLVDGYTDILKIIEFSNGRISRYFKCYKQIRMWANFFKHPKAMILTHHANYVFDRDNIPQESTLIDEAFIDKYYRTSDNNKALFDILTNNDDVYVLLPDLFKTISSFANDTQAFIKLITNNELFKQELGAKTTYEDFYEATYDDGVVTNPIGLGF